MSLPALEEKMSLCRGTVWDSEVPLMQEVAEHLLTTKDPVKNAVQPEKGLDWQCQNYKGNDKNACENAGCQLFEGKGMKVCLNKKKTNKGKANHGFGACPGYSGKDETQCKKRGCLWYSSDTKVACYQAGSEANKFEDYKKMSIEELQIKSQKLMGTPGEPEVELIQVVVDYLGAIKKVY